MSSQCKTGDTRISPPSEINLTKLTGVDCHFHIHSHRDDWWRSHRERIWWCPRRSVRYFMVNRLLCTKSLPSPPLPSPSPNLPPLRPRFPCVTQLFIQTVHHVRYLKVIIIIIIIIIIKSCNRHSSSYYISTDVKHKVILAQFFIAWEVPRSTRETENSAVAHVTSFESLRSGKFWKSLHPISHYLFVREPSVKVYLW